MLDLFLRILSGVGQPKAPEIPTQITAGDIIASYLVSLGYTATELTLDLRLEAAVLAKFTSWSLGHEKDPHSLKAARCCVGIADVSCDLTKFKSS
jgi:hypothetical protein